MVWEVLVNKQQSDEPEEYIPSPQEVVASRRERERILEEKIPNISYAQAKRKALFMRDDLDQCFEYSDAWIFSRSTDGYSIGGVESPVVIMKADGLVTTMPVYATMSHDAKEIGWWDFEQTDPMAGILCGINWKMPGQELSGI